MTDPIKVKNAEEKLRDILKDMMKPKEVLVTSFGTSESDRGHIFETIEAKVISESGDMYEISVTGRGKVVNIHNIKDVKETAEKREEKKQTEEFMKELKKI